jgi:hypothetical protein
LGRSGRGVEAVRRWKPCIAALVKFLKHEDARRLTRIDVLKWKEELLKTLGPKTVRDAHVRSYGGNWVTGVRKAA